MINKNVNQAINSLACTGCGACVTLCKKNCLTMSLDDEGFFTPQVNDEQCVKCGVCVNHCPVQFSQSSKIPITIGYISAIKERHAGNRSSSGSLFYLLAVQILKMGGVVFGCYLNQDGVAVYGYVDNLKDLEKVQGSKYVQSNSFIAFPTCVQFLEEGRLVLFSGTPCQIAGLKGCLHKNYDNLITVDLVCHGVPSPLFWKQHVKRLKSNGEVSDPSMISFRSTDKYQRCWCRLSEAVNNSDTRVIASWEKDVYYFAFMELYSLREACYRCQFADSKRISDITLGDCVTCADYKDFHPTEPVSCVFPITKKGQDLFKKIKLTIDVQNLNCDKEISANKQLHRPSNRPGQRDSFYKDYFSLPFDEFEDRYLPKLPAKYYIKEIAKRIISVRLRQKIKRIVNRIINHNMR